MSFPMSTPSKASRPERMALCTILANWFFEELESTVAPHSLALRCVHVQLHGCILIGLSLGNTDHRRKNYS